MVTRDLTRRSSAGIGYAYGAGFPDAGSLREHRFVQQYAWSGGASRRVSLRSRMEERFVTGHDAMLLRVRQQVRVTWPLAATGRAAGSGSEEVFVQANSTALAPRGFDSNRVFVGVAADADGAKRGGDRLHERLLAEGPRRHAAQSRHVGHAGGVAVRARTPKAIARTNADAVSHPASARGSSGEQSRRRPGGPDLR